MKNKLRINENLLLLLFSFLLTSSLLAQPTLSVTVQAELDNGCNLGSYCLSCDGSLTINGTASATQIKLWFHDADDSPQAYEDATMICNEAGGTMDGNACVLCNQWDPWGQAISACSGGDWNFPSATVLTDNNVSIEFQTSFASFYPPACSEEGLQFPHDSDGYQDNDENLSYVLQSLAEDCEQKPSCPAGSAFNGGPAGIVVAFVAPTDDLLNFTFNSLTIPDQLIVSIDCEEVVNSGPYSTYLTPLQVANGWHSCNPGEVTAGSGNNFEAFNIPVEAGQSVTVQVIGDNCNSPWITAWGLEISCGPKSMITYSSGTELDDEIRLYEQIIKETKGLHSESNTDLADFTISQDDQKEIDGQISLNVFPNPAIDQLNYSLIPSTEPYQLSIYNLQGKTMYYAETYGGLENISLSDFQNGLYVIQVIQADQQIIKKIQVIK